MNSSLSWLDNLKIAILNNNDDLISSLLDNLPGFNEVDDMICAREMLREYLESLKIERSSLKNDMNKIKQIKCFLEA